MNALAPTVAAAFGLTMALLCAIGGSWREDGVHTVFAVSSGDYRENNNARAISHASGW